MRLFIAVKMPFTPAINALLEDLKKCPGRVRWVEEENFHVTLKFLGEVPEATVNVVDRGLKEALEGFPSSRVRLRGLGGFPSLARPRVIWIGMDNGEVLKELHRKLETSLRKLGFERDKKSFHPHVTLGRVKRLPGATPCYEEVSAGWEGRVLGEADVDEIHLFQSTLTPRGPIYTVLRSYPLVKKEKEEVN